MKKFKIKVLFDKLVGDKEYYTSHKYIGNIVDCYDCRYADIFFIKQNYIKMNKIREGESIIYKNYNNKSDKLFCKVDFREKLDSKEFKEKYKIF